MKGIEQTLAQQLNITDREIEKRKDLLGFTDQDAEILKEHKPLFAKYLDGIVKNFYDRQIEVSEIALLIGDAEYVNKRLRIGKVHMRIGVSPKLYISAIYLLQKVLKDAVKMHFYGKDLDSEVNNLYIAMNKLIKSPPAKPGDYLI